MGMLDSILGSLGQGGQDQGLSDAQSVSKGIIGGAVAWRKRLKEEEEERQRLIAEAEAAQARKFSTYEMGDKQEKTIFGKKVGGLIPGESFDYTRSMKVTDKVTDMDRDNFTKQKENKSKEEQKRYVSGVKSKLQGYEETAC